MQAMGTRYPLTCVRSSDSNEVIKHNVLYVAVTAIALDPSRTIRL